MPKTSQGFLKVLLCWVSGAMKEAVSMMACNPQDALYDAVPV